MADKDGKKTGGRKKGSRNKMGVASVNTEEKQSGLIPYKPGQSGNPAGRPKGSRSKISEAFLSDFLGTWEVKGREALERIAAEFPSTFVRVAASLLPRQFQMEHIGKDLTDEQIKQRIRDLDAAIADLDRDEASADGVGTGAPTSATTH